MKKKGIFPNMQQLRSLFFALNANFLALSALNFADEVTWAICVVAVGYGLAIVSLQVATLYWLERSQSKWFSLAASSLFSGANFIAFYASFIEEIILLSYPLILILFASLSTLLGLGFFCAQRKRGFGRLAVYVLGSTTIGVIFFELAISIPDYQDLQITPEFDKYRIRLRETPNIHLVAFDSLMPKTLVRKFLGTEAPYADFLESRSAVVLRNMFVSQSPSVPSLNDLLRLSDRAFPTGIRALLPGRGPSPATVLLSSNGYRIKIDYPDDVLGRKGPFVDEYRTPVDTKVVRKSALCLTATEKETQFQLYGFCRLFASFGSRWWVEKTSWPDLVLEKMVEKNRNGQPSFTLQYIYMPIGHTGKSYDHTSSRYLNGYRAQYEEQSKVLTTYLNKLVEEIEARDPGSLVFIFGDHGPYLSRGVSSADESRSEFFVQDRYGAFGALLKTRHACVNMAQSAYTAEITTPARILAGIFRCLAVDPEQVDRAVQFTEDYDFRKFRYE